MIDLKTFKENAAKYFHLCMIEVQPQDVIEICERAIAAEELVEVRRQNHQNLVKELTKAAKDIRELTNKLDEIEKQEPAGVTSYMFGPMGFTTATFDASKVPVNTNVYVKPVQLSAAKPVGYLVRGTFFYSKDQAQNSCDHITENFENCIVEPVYLSAEQPKLTVWYGSMPESNGKSNWTALLHRADSKGFDMHTDGITISRSEYPERALYEADYVRWLIGELPTKPDILAYDADKHSGYVEPTQLESIIQDTIVHGTGFAIANTNGIQHVKQEDVLATTPVKPFAEIDYWQGNKMYCTMLEHAENLDIGDKLYLQPLDSIQRITEQDAREIAMDAIQHYSHLYGMDCDEWLKNGGTSLLTKLNEHREPNLQTHNLKHLELIKAKQYSFMNCALCSHSVNVAVLVRSTNCSVHICESCAHAIDSEFKQPTQR